MSAQQEVQAVPEEAADRLFGAKPWKGLEALSALEDSLHSLFINCGDADLSVSLHGEFDEGESVRIFLEASFGLIDRALGGA